MSDRRNAADYVVAGGSLLGASAAADGLVAYDRRRRKMDGPIRAATKRQFTRRHAGQVGAKIAGRAVFAAGAPLAAYGGYKMVKPDGKPVPRLDAKRDVAKPIARGVTFKDLANEQERRLVTKNDLTNKQTNTLVARKKRGQHISTAAGVMGLGALALRAPEAAKLAAKKAPKLSQMKGMGRLSRKEPSATKASNALGIVSIGVGSAGSINYAAQQKLEAQALKKNLGDGVVRGIGRVRVLSSPSKDVFDVLDNRDVRRRVSRGRLVWTKQPSLSAKKKKVTIQTPVAVTPPPASPKQMELDFGKALSPQKKSEAKARAKRNGRRYPNAYDNMISGGAKFEKAEDRFLRQYGNRISPSAQEGYKYLKRGRNARTADAAVSAGFAGLSGGLGAHALKRGSKGWAAVGGAGAALSSISAARSGRDAARWNSKMGKIKAKGKERAAEGVYAKSASQKAEGTAQVAAGTAALGVGLSTNRLMNSVENRWDSKVNARYDRIMSSVPTGKDKAGKRARGTAVSVINQQRNENLKKNPYKKISGTKGGGRVAMVTAGFAAGVPSIWMGSRKAVDKADKHDVDAFMGGALATAGAYHGGLYATKRVDRNLAQKIKTGPDFQATERSHRKTHGLNGPARKGDARWLAYHRSYPKTTSLPQGAEGPVRPMPGAKWKRSMSRLQGGKTQIAITGALATGGGLAAAKVNRKVDPVNERKVRKAFGLPTGRLVPKSPRMRKPSIRRSYVGTSMSGKKFTVRGSVR